MRQIWCTDFDGCKWALRGLVCLALSSGMALGAASAQAQCWQEAAERYHIDPLLLYAIAEVESGLRNDARNINLDGSYDIGLMQINSRHLPRLASFGITEARLSTEACTSIMAGAWILAQFIQKMGYGWQAVGAYNAGGASDRGFLRERYAQKVWRHYGVLLRQRDVLIAARETEKQLAAMRSARYQE